MRNRVDFIPPDDAALTGASWSLPSGVVSFALHQEEEAPRVAAFLRRFVAGLRGQRVYLAGIVVDERDMMAWDSVAPIVLIGVIACAGGTGARVVRADADSTLTGWAVVGIDGNSDLLMLAADNAVAACQNPHAREAYLDRLADRMRASLEAADLPLGALDDLDIRIATRHMDGV